MQSLRPAAIRRLGGMTKATGRGAALIAAIVAVAALALGGTASAHDTDWGPWGAHDCDAGRATGDGAMPLATFKFTVCANDHDPHDVAGYFRATGNFGSGVLIAPEGPVTCAVFQGDEVSFLYPLVGNKPPVPPNSTSILIYAKAGGVGQGKTGFFMAPTATFGNKCGFETPQAIAAKTDALPLTKGSVSVTSRKS